MQQLQGRVAVITGAASGIGLALAQRFAREGMRLVLADIEAAALARVQAQFQAQGVPALAVQVDVMDEAQVAALADAAYRRYGAVHLLCNNAGVTAPALRAPTWETRTADWQWVLGVNLMGVVHGVRSFVPMMLEAAKRDPGYEGHVINTASMAGLVNPPNMGVYNVSKHAVVSLSETLYQDLRLVTDQIGASVLCPFFVSTGITRSERNRPADLAGSGPTKSQRLGQAMTDRAVGSGKVTAATVAQQVFDALREQRFYIYSHPRALGSVQSRMEDLLQPRNPSDPFAAKPEVGAELRAALRAAD